MIEEVFISIGVVGLICATIVLIIWIRAKARINTTDKETELILNLIEKNPDIDIKSLLTRRPKKSFIEKLLLWLRAGAALTIIGIGLILYICIHQWIGCSPNYEKESLMLISIILIGLGAGLLISYFIGKTKFLKKENN